MRKSLLIPFGLAAVGAIAIFRHMLFLRESRPAVAIAVARADQSKEVTRIVGGPMRVTHVTGHLIGVGYSDGSGNADLAIDVRGPKGTGKGAGWISGLAFVFSLVSRFGWSGDGADSG